MRLIEGDCLQVLPTLEAGSFDTVITDPPYGIGFPYLGYDDTRGRLRQLIAGALPHLRRIAPRVYVLCGITQMHLYPEPDWAMAVTWNTTGSFGKYGYTQWMPVLCYGKDVVGFGRINGVLKSDLVAISGGAGVGFRRDAAEKLHTCPKPLNLMRLLARRLTAESETILDPFAGSGTTGVAAMLEGRNAVLIEREPAYCDIIRNRLEKAQSEGPLFAKEKARV